MYFLGSCQLSLVQVMAWYCLSDVGNYYLKIICCLSGKLWHLQHNCVEDTLVYHEDSKMIWTAIKTQFDPVWVLFMWDWLLKAFECISFQHDSDGSVSWSQYRSQNRSLTHSPLYGCYNPFRLWCEQKTAGWWDDNFESFANVSVLKKFSSDALGLYI